MGGIDSQTAIGMFAGSFCQRKGKGVRGGPRWSERLVSLEVFSTNLSTSNTHISCMNPRGCYFSAVVPEDSLSAHGSYPVEADCNRAMKVSGRFGLRCRWRELKRIVYGSGPVAISSVSRSRCLEGSYGSQAMESLETRLSDDKAFAASRWNMTVDRRIGPEVI